VKPWTIRAVEFARTTRGWRCEVAFRVSTHRQFTMEEHAVVAGSGGWTLLDAAVALWRALRERRRMVRDLQALPGPWTLDGRPATETAGERKP
jgi:predicted DCC family thiol-disulfide oxidoreductase YuxK